MLRAAVGNTAQLEIQYIGVSSAVQANGASVTCDVPSGAVAGDLLVAFSNQTGTTTSYTMTPPSGWTETLDTIGRWSGYLPSWDGTTSTYTFTKSNAAADPSVVMLAFRNAVYDVQGELSSGSANPVAPSINLLSNDSVVVACFSTAAQSASYTTPSGFTEVADPALGIAVSYKADVSSGASGTVTATASAGTTSRGYLIGIKPKTNKVTSNYIANIASSADASSYTFTNAPIAGAGLIVVVAHTEGVNSVSSATIGGVSATINAQVISGGVTQKTNTAIFSAVIGSGSTATIVVNYGGTQARCGIAIYQVTGYSSTTPVTTVTNSAASGTGLSATLNSLSVNDAVIAGCTVGDGGNAVTWTNIRENYDNEIAGENAQQSGGNAIVGSSGNYTITTSHSSSGDGNTLTAAAWR